MSGLKDLFAEKGAKGSSLVWLENFLLGKIKKNYMTKEECSKKLTEMVSGGGGIHVDAPQGAYQYKGQVASYDDLPTDEMTDDTVGYTYDAKDTGMNWAWNGLNWDNLGAIYSFNALTEEELEILFASTDESGLRVPEVSDDIKWLYSGTPRFTITSDETAGNTRTINVEIGGPVNLSKVDKLSIGQFGINGGVSGIQGFSSLTGSSTPVWSEHCWFVPFGIELDDDLLFNISLRYQTGTNDLVGDKITGGSIYSGNNFSARQALKGIPIILGQKHRKPTTGYGYTILKAPSVTLTAREKTIQINFTTNLDEVTFLGAED